VIVIAGVPAKRWGFSAPRNLTFYVTWLPQMGRSNPVSCIQKPLLQYVK